ncbi:MAG: glycosyltransferase [Candidatus Marinimicrobia bacterium]|nr:glycosyltransferase [Candidatus Neomarinimicrobiota bacterium]
MKLNVIQFSESFPPLMDGVGNVTRNYAYWIKLKYGKSYVVTPEYPAYVDDEVFPVLRYPSIPLVMRKPYRLGVGQHSPKLWKKLSTLNVDIVHAQSPFSSGNIALQFARQKEVPLVATFHSKFYDDFKEATRSDAISWLMTHLVVDFFNYADAVWAVNESTRETLISYGYKGQVDVVPNGADFTVPGNLDALMQMANKNYGISDEDLVFLFVGQMIKQKNIPMIIDSLGLLKKAGVKFTMLFVGEGKSKEDFQTRVKQLGLGDQVKFLGKILDRDVLKSIFARSDLFIFPSVYDNAPVVTREAAAVGTPSIIVRDSNAAEGIIHGENGYLCENSAESIAESILKIVSDREALKKTGEKAQTSIFRSWESVVDDIVVPKYLEIIEKYK